MHYEHAVGRRGAAFEQGGEAQPVERSGLDRLAADLEQRGKQILRLRGPRHVARGQVRGRPAHEKRHAMSAVVVVGFVTAEAGIVDRHAGGAAIVRGENHDGVFAQAALAEEGLEPAHVLVDVREHPEEGRGWLALEERGVFRRHLVRRMRGVQRHVAEERLVRRRPLAHPAHRFIETEIRDVAAEPRLRCAAIAAPIEERVREFRRAREAPPFDPDRGLKPAIHRPVRIAVTEVPLPEHRGAVAGCAELLRQGRYSGANEGAAGRDRRRGIAQRIAAGEELAARGRTHRRHMEVGEAHAFIVQPIDVRGLQKRMPVAAEVAVPGVVHQHEEDVGPFSRGCEQCAGEEERETGEWFHGVPIEQARRGGVATNSGGRISALEERMGHRL